MANPIRWLLQRQSLEAEVRSALEAGVGLYQASWTLDAGVPMQALATELIAWCRSAAGEMQRPYGLDHVSLTISCFTRDAQEAGCLNFGVLRPLEFYGSGTVEEALRAKLHSWAEERLFTPGGGQYLTAVLFSWGDLTRELLPAA